MPRTRRDPVALLRWARPGLIGLVGLVAIGYLVLEVVPDWFADTKGLDAKGRVDAREGVRTAALALLGATLGVVGAIYLARSSALSRSGRTTERFIGAIDQLERAQLEGRLGGIYALERIARDSADAHAQVMEVLTVYVRARAPGRPRKAARPHRGTPEPPDASSGGRRAKSPQPPAKPPTDVQAALTVIGRRKVTHESPEENLVVLSGTDLRGADLVAAHLERANLKEARLEGADLVGANLEGANLVEANLEAAYLVGTNLEAAVLAGAKLEGAYLIQANLAAADLTRAHLDGADLVGADLRGADLTRARLEGADLVGANLEWTDRTEPQLEGAYLRQTRLEGADLTRAHLEGADLVGANMEGAKLIETRLEGANLRQARLEGADLRQAHLEGADLRQAHLEGADLADSHLAGADLCAATYDAATQWPEGFAPEVAVAPSLPVLTARSRWSRRLRLRRLRRPRPPE